MSWKLMFQTILDFPVLSKLACGEMRAYAVVRSVRDVPPHLVYSTLRRLREEGLVLQHRRSSAGQKSFRLSKRGRRLLGEELLWRRFVVGNG